MEASEQLSEMVLAYLRVLNRRCFLGGAEGKLEILEGSQPLGRNTKHDCQQLCRDESLYRISSSTTVHLLLK